MASASQRKAWNEAMRSAAGVSALPKSLQPRTQKRRSDRRKKQDRRDKARKVQTVGMDNKEFMGAALLDALEDVNATNTGDVDDDDSYDELDEEEDKRKRKRRAPKKIAGVLPKRFKPRSVASILLEEINREDGSARAWINAEARVKNSKETSPPRKYCPVTGQLGIYVEPKSGIPYANLKALEQIRERPPPWMTLSGGVAFHEALQSIRDEENTT